MSKKQAQEKAAKLAIAKLANVNIAERATSLGLPAMLDGIITLPIFGESKQLDKEFNLTIKETGKPAKPDERILLLHYLANEFPAQETGELITFRSLPSGEFYWNPFQARSVKPLIGRVGNDLDLLKNNLNRFDWQEANLGDFAARIHLFANMHATLIYQLGDEEFPPDANLLFDSSIKRLFPTEDVAVIASRICIGLL
ncbi:MAG: DUF3786 domain-containing protein [Victivallales bacterium]|nr:DUF3786 domain-containing protein [Victivallales bacterium]